MFICNAKVFGDKMQFIEQTTIFSDIPGDTKVFLCEKTSKYKTCVSS